MMSYLRRLHHGGRWWLRAGVLGIMWVLPLLGSAAQERFQFRFAPPDGVSYIEAVTLTKVRELGQGRMQTDVAQAETNVTIKKTPSGYNVVGVPSSLRMTRNGTKVEGAFVTAPLGATITYELDKNGQIQKVTGYKELVRRLVQSLPQAAASVSSVLNEETMVRKDVAEWNGRIGNFVGREVQIGDVWTSSDEFSLPTGDVITFHSVTHIAGKEQCGTLDCIRVRFAYHSDADALKDYVAKVLGDVANRAGVKPPGMKPGRAGVLLEGSGERVVDPATMLIYSERYQRTLKLPMRIPGQGEIVTALHETKEYRFDYGKKR